MAIRPPQGYHMADKPLHHFTVFTGDTAAESAAFSAFIFPLVTNDSAIVPSSVNVHPEHASYVEEDTRASCAKHKRSFP